MKRGEMLTGRSVSADCGLRIAECGFKAAGRGFQVGRVVLAAGVLCALVGLLVGLRFGFGVNAATDAGGRDKSADGVWQRTQALAGEWAGRSGVPESAVVFKLDESALRLILAQAPLEDRRGDGATGGRGDGEKDGRGEGVVVWLPMPGGGFARFRVVEAPVMKPELAEQFPEIKSYRGWGIDDGRLTMRCDLSPLGFHAAITDGAELMAIHPVQQHEREHYVSYSSRSYAAAAESAMCLVNDSKVIRKITPRFSSNSSVGDNVRNYDVAVTTTQEYTNMVCGSDPDPVTCTVGTLNTWFDALNLIFDRELSIHLNLVTSTSLIYQFEPDPFNNGVLNTSQQNGTGMVDQVRAVLGGSGLNYDLGLVLGTPLSGAGSGSAYVGVVCETASDSFGPYKGGGAVLVSGSVGNTDSAYLMAHEIGHQFGATHTHNANIGCGERYGDTAWESGSGLTLMSNAGGCGANNIASARSSHFHSGSFEQIIGYLNVLGSSCAALAGSGNNPPTVNGGADYVIPKQTPFALTATGNDPGDMLSYAWEQMDAGGLSFFNPPYADQPGDATLTTRPIFRPFDPVSSSIRLFPRLQDILSGQNAAAFENLPQVTRAMNFRVTARDQHGGVANDSVRLEVDGNAGPFAVTSPNTAVNWLGNSQQTVTWNKAGTDANLVGCANVKISLSTDGGQNFSTLVSTTPNTGSAQVTIPNIATTTARIKVEAIGNIFFDISNVNFTVTAVCSYSLGSSSASFSAGSGTGSVGVTAGAGCPWAATSNAAWITITSGASGTGNGAVNYSVTANTGAARSGTMTIAGQIFTVTQSASSTTGLQFYPLSKPIRLLDTRAGEAGCDTPGAPIAAGTDRTQLARRICDGVTIPATALAITGNITPISNAQGFLTLYPTNAIRPVVANSNFVPGEVVNNVYTVGLGADGSFKIYASATTEVIVDVSGYFAPPGAGGLYFHPLPQPIRLLETRSGETGCDTPGAPINGGTSRTQPGRVTCSGITIPNAAQALAGNATVVFPATSGHITLYPSTAAQPLVSSGNYVGNDVVNTPFTVGLGTDGAFKIFTSATTHIVIDVLGYYSPDATDVNGTGYLFYSLGAPVRLLDSRAGQSACYTPGASFTGGVEYSQQARGACGGQTVPANAAAVLGNVTTVNPIGGYLTLWPSNAVRPLVSTSNFATGQIANRHFIVGLGPDGAFKLFASGTTDLVIDLSGYFAP